MATVNYKLKYTKTTESRIYFRFVKGRQYQTVMQTPIKIPPDSWNEKKQQVRKGLGVKGSTVESINSKLGQFEAYLIDQDRLAGISGELVNTPWLKHHTNTFFSQSDKSNKWSQFFEDYIERFIENTELNPQTKKNIVTSQKVFLKFQAYKKRIYQFKELNANFNKEFNDWALKTEKYAPSSVSKNIKVYRQIIKRAKTEGVLINEDVSEFKPPKNNRENLDIYLKPEQIEEIHNYIPPTPSMANVKNLFLVGLYTGLRVSDLMRFNKSKGVLPEDKKKYTQDQLRNILPLIKNGNIEIVTIKTQQLCVIPIHKRIKNLLDVIRPISDVKFNEYIKDIGKALEWNTLTWGYRRIDKRNVLNQYKYYLLLRSHVCRRSYATNRVDHDKDSLNEVRSATGHTTTQELENYIKTTKYDHAEKKQEKWRSEERMRAEKQK